MISVAKLEKGERVTRCWIDNSTTEYVIEVRRNDGALTEERVSLLERDGTMAPIVREFFYGGGSMKDS